MNVVNWVRSLGGGDRQRVAALRNTVAEARKGVARWKARYADEAGKVAAVSAQLVQARERVSALSVRLRAYRAGVNTQRLRATEAVQHVARLEASLLTAKRIADRNHRSVPVPGILKGTLPLRLPLARARARQDDARAREQRFLAVSTSYAEALAGIAEAPAPDVPVLKTTLQGLHWWVPVLRPGDGAPDSNWLKKQKFPYRGIVQTRELAMGGIMLDLGANLGRMSLPRVILGDVQVAYCAEPDPLNYACLVRNIADNGLRGLVLADNVAIGDRQGTATLSRQRYSGGHTLASGPAKTGTVDVRTTTLDAWVDQLGVDPDLVTYVKMDVQGWEGHVCAGAAGVLARRHITWQVEFQPSLLVAAGTNPADLLRIFAASFTHFTDLNKLATGVRGRPTAELADAARYLDDDPSAKTDFLLFNQVD